MSPSASTSGWPGQGQVGLHGHAAGPVDLDAGSPRELRRPAREAVTPAAQIAVRAATRSTVAVRGPDRDRVGVDVDHRVAGERLTPSFSSAARRLRRKRLGEGGQHAVGRPRRAARARSRVSAERKSRRSASWASSAICPAISTPVGPAPTTTNVSQLRAAVPDRLHLGRLERPEHAASDVERAGERLQLGRVLPPLVVTEVGVPRPARDDQGVVGKGCAAVAVRQVVEQRPRDGRGRTRSPPPARRVRCAVGAGSSRSGVAISAAASAPVAAW